MTEEVVIGQICYKGNHLALKGEADYGCCGSHYYAEIRISLVPLYGNPRGDELPSVESVAGEIAEIVSRREELEWRLDGD